MSWMWQTLLAFACAVLSALGMGGGGLLLLYLVAYAGMEQRAAQGINLVFFIPIAILAVLMHTKKGLIQWKLTLLCALLGLGGVYLGWALAMWLDETVLSKFFGGFLLIVGVRELVAEKREES